MRLTLAMLADFALAHPDGKLYITGGGLHSLQVGEFPATHPHVSLALELYAEPTDAGRAHTVLIQAHGPSGEVFIAPTLLSAPSSSPISADPQFVQFIFNMSEIVFPQAGVYTFAIDVDDIRQAEVALRVTQGVGVQLESTAEAATLLARGYESFASGDLLAAEEQFRSAIEITPQFSMAHNNLGFVYLANGQVERALASFNRARELRFGRLELLDANCACCYYLLDNYSAALPLFETSLANGVFVGSSVLFGICRSDLFLVHLPSASAYSALMALNAGWTALRMGQLEISRRHLEIARAIQDDASLGDDFANAVTTLERDLATSTE